MLYYKYNVRDQEGRLATGILEAESKNELRDRLTESGYYVVKILPYKEKKSLFGKKKVSSDELIAFTMQLSKFIEAGIPLLQALETLWRQIQNKEFQVIVSQIKDQISEGKPFSLAIDKFPRVFPYMYRQMAKLGEAGPQFYYVLKEVGLYLKRQRQFSLKLKKAVSYPVFVLGFALVVALLMLLLVVPVYKQIFTRLNIELPFITQILLDLSDFLTAYGWVFIVLAVFLVFLYRRIAAREKGRYKIDYYKLRIPLTGPLLYKGCIARFLRSFAFMIKAGVSAYSALNYCREVVDNKILEDKIAVAEEKVITSGESLSLSLERAGFLNAAVLQLISSGESSGKLSEMTNEAANFAEDDLDRYMDQISQWVEPLLIIIIGFIVGGILLAMYYPVFSLWSQMG